MTADKQPSLDGANHRDTKQEMFDKAVRGLRSQGFQVCESEGSCIYSDGQGNHCAWGWIDPESWAYGDNPLSDLHKKGVGLAASLDDELLGFAQDLQACHDRSDNHNLEAMLRRFGIAHRLTWPEES